MICPNCSADTRVVDSRLHREDARVVVRKRVCEGCGHRFQTQEGTVDIAAMREKRRVAQLAWKRRLDPAVKVEKNARANLRRDAKIEAAETGRPLAEILKAWGASAPHSLPRQQAQR